MRESKSTITDLPDDIEQSIPEGERTQLINTILTEARAGQYHDYKNEKYVCGKIAVVEMLSKCNDGRLQHIINKVRTGYYDEEADEQDVAQMKKDWLLDGGTEESWKQFFEKK